MPVETGTLIYMYGIVPADAPDAPSSLAGLDDQPVSLVRTGGVAALVSAVPASLYSDDVLNARLDDLQWVGARGMEHERVLDWYAERVSVIPLSLFSLHLDADRVEARVRAGEAEYSRLLDRLRGRKEWGIKLWRSDTDASEGIDRISPSLRDLAIEIESAPPGKRFLLERKRETMRSEELRAASKRLAHELFAALRERSDSAVAVPLPATLPGGDRSLLMHAAFLVHDDNFETFRKVVNEHAARFAGSGFTIEFTGPWPPYHFSASDDE